jgi:hypothetical protein
MKADSEKMLAKIGVNHKMTDANQERMNVNLREMREEVKSRQAEMESRVGAIQEKMDACIAEMKDGRKKETMTCQQHQSHFTSTFLYKTLSEMR